MEIQTRDDEGNIRYYRTLESALIDAKADVRVWKVSFNAVDGSRVRLIRTHDGWIFEDINSGRYI